MKPPNAVWRNINGWRSAASHFRKWARRKGKTWVFNDPTQGDVVILDIEVKAWRQQLARLIRQCRQQRRANNHDWFYWLDEYGSMISATLHEDYRKYDKTIIRGGKAMKQTKAASVAANAPKKARADAKVLQRFNEWRGKVAAVLYGLTLAQQVRKYHIVKRPAPRDKRRLNALLKAGAIQ